MKATDFEFRNRWYLIGGIFCLAFSMYSLDHRNSIQVLFRWLSQHAGPAWHKAMAFHIAFGAGAFLALLAALLRTWAAAYIHWDIVHDANLHSARLVADGPYRFVRNPLYIGTILVAFAFAPMANPAGAIILIVGVTAFVSRLIVREEGELLRSQGESFRRYVEAVPRIWPSLRPRVPASGNRPKWLQAFPGEIMCWGFFVALSLFAITFDLRAYGITAGCALAASLVVNLFARRKHAARAAGAE